MTLDGSKQFVIKPIKEGKHCILDGKAQGVSLSLTKDLGKESDFYHFSEQHQNEGHPDIQNNFIPGDRCYYW